MCAGGGVGEPGAREERVGWGVRDGGPNVAESGVSPIARFWEEKEREKNDPSGTLFFLPFDSSFPPSTRVPCAHYPRTFEVHVLGRWCCRRRRRRRGHWCSFGAAVGRLVHRGGRARRRLG